MSNKKYLRELYGALTLPNLKKGIGLTRNILEFARGVDKIAGDKNLRGVKRLTEKLINNDAFNKLSRGVEIGSKIIDGIEQSQRSGIFNKNASGINEIGKDFALKRRREVLDGQRVETKPVRSRPIFKNIIEPLDETKEAERIVSEIS